MYVDDQDEDVEEEEEFHEVEEEKHKTSQDAVNDSNCNDAETSEKSTSSAPSVKDIDWANIMLRSQSRNSDQPTTAEILSSDTAQSEVKKDSQDVERPSDDSIMNNIIKDTQDKLKIADESCDSVDQKIDIQSEKILGENTIELETGHAASTLDEDHDSQNSIAHVEGGDAEKGEPSESNGGNDEERNLDAKKPEQADDQSREATEEERSDQVDQCSEEVKSDHFDQGSDEKQSDPVEQGSGEEKLPVEQDSDEKKFDQIGKDLDGNNSDQVDQNSDEKRADEVEKKEPDHEEQISNENNNSDQNEHITDVDKSEQVEHITDVDKSEQVEHIADVDKSEQVEHIADENKSDQADQILDEEKSDQIEQTSDEKKPDEVEKKELDLDEDVKNPQYIPKKGVFYEHDDRSHDVDEKKPSGTLKKEDDSVEAKDANASKKTSSQDKQPESRRPNRRQRTDADRWNHDLFRGEKQKPKSKSELINAYGYDIRQERGNRNQQSDRQPRTNNSSNADRPQTSQDGQRSRQSKDSRVQRQNQPSNRSRERRARRQNVSKNAPQRNDGAQGLDSNRRGGDMTNNRSSRPDVKDSKETGDEKHATPPSSSLSGVNRREQEVLSSNNRNPRNDSRGRRKTSRDRPTNDDRLPPPNAVMPPITTWSNEDMMKAEAFGKKSPPRMQNQNATAAVNSNNSSAQRDRSTDFWQQNQQQNKNIHQDRPMRNQDESRHQSYNSRGRYQERGDENHRSAHYMSRNHYNERTNQNPDWHRASNFSPYGKSNDYVVKTQTFENSRLTQANMNRSSNARDLREVINERRMQGQQNFQNKVHHNVDNQASQRGPNQGQIYQHKFAQSHHLMHQQMSHNQQASHMIQPQQALPTQHQHHQQSQQQTQRHQQLPASSQQQASSQTQPQTNPQAQQQQGQQLQNHRQQPTTQSQSRQNIVTTTENSGGQDSVRLGGPSNADPLNSRPIIKTDAYTGMHPHQQPLTQHSQNHRSMSGPMAQQSSAPTASHMVPSHLGASTSQAQYYTPSPGSRDPAASAAAVATAYHGYIPGGHAVMDATRYHMASQQLADHGYMTTPGQTSDVSGGTVLHQQSMYPDTSAGGAVAGSAYLAQPPGSTISPTTNIPVTGTGPQPLPPVSYIQHSQYHPPPYSNPYTQPQHNQAPPQSGHAYPPYWTYI